ncbi:N-acylneuraminate cytidylyltransferase [Maridesulfovibrio ferrireducens]|uniref:N-acylneuraminate cytidylyltransferase n=1 Tax=Maridesulfovibrio ferrireducens TaxID=246191 RepID=A0A1G9B6B6_9BACT|nr:pseudaminic acid cytidylyltransferase [Maridesulfovibrio ferrireducens]SDK34415.1 N-acylneuraminate cytidylyltransferase [Maridesulfovibrio ferrireducens]
MQVAIIPARGGSKRIPKKSIRPFLGKPLIAYAIEAARESGFFDHIIVSTDSEEFAEVVKEYGAEVPFMRPAELAGDFVATAPVIEHALDWVKENLGQPERFCQFFANPFITAETLRGGYKLMREKKANCVLGVTEFAYPILRAFKLNEQGGVQYAFPEYAPSRSQDLPTFFHDAAQFYWQELTDLPPDRTEGLNLPYFLPRHMAVDIDTIEDWEIAERLYKAFVLDA